MSSSYAIVQVFGRQFKVKEGDTIRANYKEAEVGSKITFSEVLMVSQEGNLKVGAPFVGGAQIQTSVHSHGRGEKVHILKYLRKNKLKTMRGHRQPYTFLTIDSIEC